ncbi:MAG: LON peptidase substrate-binding domain-containing protein [Planctomycetota bacterium]|nr:LON peptidase substrate-binding domain-containing protein [Planctomycetota bacterium]
MSDWSFNLSAYPESARLFPIPGLVMFPHVMQPLHVFEHRYRALLADTLDDDQLIALPVLSSCEQEITSLPPLEPVACLTKVVSHQKLADGCSNLLVIGVARIRLCAELPAWEPYRRAEVVVLEEQEPTGSETQRQKLRDLLLAAFKKHLASELQDLSCLDGLLDRDLSLAVLTDLIAHTLPLDMELKVQLLAETDVEHRAAILQQRLCEPMLRSTRSLTPAGVFPPGFSVN